MSREETLKSLITKEQEKALVEFLIALTDEEREALVSIVKHLVLHYRTVRNPKVYLKPENRHIGSEKQIMMTYITCFCCLNKKDFELMKIYYHNNSLIQKIEDYNILEGYCPSWFDQYVQEHIHIISSYKQFLGYTQKGYIKPNKELVLHSLRNGIVMDIDEIPDITIDEHIWYLFEENFWFDSDKSRSLFELFGKLVEIGRVDMHRVIKSALNALLREDADVKFFVGLIESLKVNDSVLLSLQEDMLAVCETTQNKAIHLCVRYLRNLSTNSKFEIDLFLDKTAVLLSNQNKAILNATISILDKLMKAHPKRVEELALILTQALSTPDTAIQIRVIKTLKKHNMLESSSLLDEIALYDTLLFHEAKELLPAMPSVEIADEPIVTQALISDENKIPKYESLEELLFFFTQLLENYRIENYDLGLYYLQKLNTIVDSNNVEQLQPIFGNAEKKYRRGGFNRGIIAAMILELIFHYALIVEERFPSQSEYIQGIFERNPEIKHWLRYARDEGKFYQLYKELSIWVEEQLSSTTQLPILSTPTHTPCWIGSEEFVDRLAHYQSQDIQPNLNDYQIALNRLSIETLEYIKQKLSGEYRDILLYLGDGIEFELGLVETPTLWITALLRKNTKSDIEQFVEIYEGDVNYPYSIPQWDIEVCEHNNTHIFLKAPILETQQENIFSKIVEFDKERDMLFAGDYYDLYPYDGAVFLLLSPHYLDYSLYFILKVYLLPRRHVNINPTRQAINILPVVYELWGRDNVGELSYLYLSLSLIDKDKNVRLIASDLWVKAISEGNLDSRLLGLTLGKLEAIPYAPIKRFTDLIIASMLNISSLHNQSLYSILSSMIPQMNDEPINGHKKFLEIYMEVLSLTQQQAPQDVLEKLGVWGEVKSLSAIVKKIGM